MVLVTWNDAFDEQHNLGQPSTARLTALTLASWSPSSDHTHSVQQLVRLMGDAIKNCTWLPPKYWFSLCMRLLRPHFLVCSKDLFKYASSGRHRTNDSQCARKLFLRLHYEVMLAAGCKGLPIFGVSRANPITPDEQAKNLQLLGNDAAGMYLPIRDYLLQPEQLRKLSRLLQSQKEGDAQFAVQIIYHLLDDPEKTHALSRFLSAQLLKEEINDAIKERLRKRLDYIRNLAQSAKV